jgi:hypothetical protein
MISWRNVQQSTDRIARTVLNIAVCRTFMRSVLTVIITNVGDLSPASPKYRPQIDRLEMSRFAGLSPPR